MLVKNRLFQFLVTVKAPQSGACRGAVVGWVFGFFFKESLAYLGKCFSTYLTATGFCGVWNFCHFWLCLMEYSVPIGCILPHQWWLRWGLCGLVDKTWQCSSQQVPWMYSVPGYQASSAYRAQLPLLWLLRGSWQSKTRKGLQLFSLSTDQITLSFSPYCIFFPQLYKTETFPVPLPFCSSPSPTPGLCRTALPFASALDSALARVTGGLSICSSPSLINLTNLTKAP